MKMVGGSIMATLFKRKGEAEFSPVEYQRTHPATSNQYNNAHEDLRDHSDHAESYAGTIGRNIGASALKAGNALFELYKLPAYLIQPFLPEKYREGAAQRLGKSASEYAGVDPDFLRTRNTYEDIAQGFGSKLPYLIPGAQGGLAARLAAGGAGTLAGVGAEKAGFGPLSRAGIEFGTEIGAGKLSGALPALGKKASNYWKKAEELGEKAGLLPAPHLQRGLNQVDELLLTQSDPKLINQIRNIREHTAELVGAPNPKIAKQLNALENAILHEPNVKKIKSLQKRFDKLYKEPHLNPATAMAKRKTLNEEINKLPWDKQKLLTPLRDSINDYFAHTALENPEFYDNLSKSDQLTTLKHASTRFGDWLKKESPTSLASAYAATKALGIKGAGLILAKEFGKEPIKAADAFVARLFSAFKDKPQVRAYYGELLDAIGNQNTKNIADLTNALGEELIGTSIIPESLLKQEKKSELSTNKAEERFKIKRA